MSQYDEKVREVMQHAPQQGCSSLANSRQAKHIESVMMVDSLNRTILKLQDLIDEITGQPASPNKTGPDVQNPTLAEFLDTTPEVLHQINNRLEDQIGHLRDILL